MWIFLSLVSALSLSVKHLIQKPIAGKLNYFTLGWATQLFSLPSIALLFLVSDRNITISSAVSFWLPLAIIWVVLYPIQTHCFFSAIHRGNISEVIPILSFVPVFTMLLAFVFVGEVPSISGFFGILLTVFGVFLLNTASIQHVHNILSNKSALLMLLTSISIAIGSALDKVALSASSPRFYTLINVAGSVVVLYGLSYFHGKKKGSEIKSYFRLFLIIGLAQSLFYLFYIFALQDGITSYVVAIRNLNVLTSAFFGIVFFKENFTKRKLMSFFLIGVGLVFLSIA